MDVGEASNETSRVLIEHKKCKRVENICRFACHIAEACFDEGVRRKIAERGYAIDDETCLLSLPDDVVKDVHKALRAYRVCLEVNDPDRARNRWERLHFLPQTTEAEEGGIVCLRGLNRDPRNCDGFDCPLEIYGACVDMLAEGTEVQEKTSMDLSDSTKRRKIDA